MRHADERGFVEVRAGAGSTGPDELLLAAGRLPVSVKGHTVARLREWMERAESTHSRRLQLEWRRTERALRSPGRALLRFFGHIGAGLRGGQPVLCRNRSRRRRQ